jgi:O-antigen ligase
MTFITFSKLFPVYFLIFIMILIPSGHQVVKGFFMFFIVIIFLFELIYKKVLAIDRQILTVFVFFVFIGLFYAIYGLFRGNLGVFPVTKEIVIYPILYFIIISLISNYDKFIFLNNVIIFSSLFLCIYIIASIANSFGILPDSLYISLETEDTEQDINVGTIEAYGRLYASFSSLPMLMFLQPYLFNYILVNKRSRIVKWIIFITFLIMTLIMCLVGRRILLIVSIIFPIIIFYFHKRNPKLINFNFSFKHIVFLLSLIFLLFVFISIKLNLDFFSIYEHFLFSFQFEQFSADGKYVENVRIETFRHLMTKWLDSPFFGYGSGAHDPDYYRSEETPWNYEIFYVYFLFSFGLAGLLVYGLGIYYIYINSLKIFKNNSIYSSYSLSALFGMIAFLIGSATNPYLLKLESLIVIFLPIMIINLDKKVKRFSIK